MDLYQFIRKNRIDNVRLVKGPRADRKGSIAITGHHFIFSAESSSKEDELWVRFEYFNSHKNSL